MGALLTVRQAAERLGVSPALVYALVAGKRIRHERHGLGRGVVRIPEDALEEYRRGTTVEAATVVPTAHRRTPVRLKHLEA
jgi:excisionase family DNA binding protein